MKILFVNHGTADTMSGGDGVQMRETAKRLAQRGHQVVAVNSDRPEVAGFDLVHIFNCRAFHSFHQQMQVCGGGIPTVVSRSGWTFPKPCGAAAARSLPSRT